MVDLVRSLSLQGRSRRNALLALRTLQQERTDVVWPDVGAVYPEDPVRPRAAEPAQQRTAEPA